MKDRFNVKYPRMKPLKEAIYGKQILFAGAESEKFQDALYSVGVKGILVSFQYLRKKSDAYIRSTLEKFNFVMLDSGAFTFLQRLKKGEQVTDKFKEDLTAFTREYIEFVDRLSSCFTWVVEMDACSHVSEEFHLAHLEEIRSRGIRLLPVIHGKPVEWYKERGYFDNYDALCIAGKLTGGLQGFLVPYITECKKNGILKFLFYNLINADTYA